MVRIPSMNVRSFVVLFSASGIGFHRSWLGVSTNLERSPWPKLLKEVDEDEDVDGDGDEDEDEDEDELSKAGTGSKGVCRTDG